MKEIKEIDKNQNVITNSIKKYGHCVEHNFHHFKYIEEKDEENVFIKLENKKGILSTYDKKLNIWHLFPSGILAPEHERYDILLQFLDYTLNKKKGSKLCVEIHEDFRREVLKKIKSSKKFRACASPFILYWPIFKMSDFDPKLKGKKWKKIRNIKNRFFKDHKVKVVDSKKVPKEQLLDIFNTWLKKRNANDRVEKDYFKMLIENNFKGTDMAKTLIVDGKPSSITAGWRVPNSNNYYSHVGLLDYSVKGLGEVANLIDLKLLKGKNYDYVDFGGSDKELLYFKKKFKPEKIYKTYIFSLKKR